jgi:hypothetical protein
VGGAVEALAGRAPARLPWASEAAGRVPGAGWFLALTSSDSQAGRTLNCQTGPPPLHFSRYRKYTLGTDLRTKSREVVARVIKAAPAFTTGQG